MVSVMGKSAGTGKVYGGFVYAQLRDPRTHDTIDVRIPEGLSAELWQGEGFSRSSTRHRSAARTTLDFCREPQCGQGFRQRLVVLQQLRILLARAPGAATLIQ